MKNKIKDINKHKTFKSGMVREIEGGKPRYDLIYLPFLKDWADVMAAGAKKYNDNNWQQANSIEELIRFKASAFRHFMQFMSGETDEPHHVMVAHNLSGIQMVMKKLNVNIHGEKLNGR